MICKSRKAIIQILPKLDGCKMMFYGIRVKTDKHFLAKLGLPHMNGFFPLGQLYANYANIMGSFRNGEPRIFCLRKCKAKVKHYYTVPKAVGNYPFIRVM
jgi:hypothetical protein